MNCYVFATQEDSLTKDQLKAYKAYDSYNQFVSG